MAVTVTNVSGIVYVTLSASGDSATPQQIINAGFGNLISATNLNTIRITNKIWLRIATGATFDCTGWNWVLESGASLRFDDSYGCGTWRKGWRLLGGKWVKIHGGTVYYVNFDASNNQGGRSIGAGTSAPPGYPSNKPVLHWNDVSWVAKPGTNNGSAALSFNYASFGDTNAGTYCGFIMMDHLGDANGLGANAGFKGSFGYIEELTIAYANSGASTGADTTSIVQVGKLNYLGLYYGNNQVNTKFSVPSNLPFTGFAPVIINPDNNEYWGFFIPTNGFNAIYDDPTFPSGYAYREKHYVYQRTGATNIRRRVQFDFKDSVGDTLTDVTLRLVSSGDELVNAVQAGDYDAQTLAAQLLFTTTNSNYRPPNTIKNYSVHSYKARKYGYIEQTGSYNIEEEAYSSPLFHLPDTYVSAISEATIAALTSVSINWTTKTITVSADADYDEVNAKIAYELAQTTHMAEADPRTFSGSQLTLATGWSMAVNTGVVLSAGEAVTFISVPSITLNGTAQIQGIYGTSAGVSTILELRDVTDGSAYIIANNSTKATILYGTNSTGSTQTYTAYFPPGSAGTQVLVAREKYGYNRTAEVVTLAEGGMWYTFVDVEDVGISETDQATVAAYITIENADKFYDRTALFRLTEAGIKLGQIAERDGTSLRVSDYNIVVDQLALSVYSVGVDTITIKALGYANGTKYINTVLDGDKTLTASTNEVISADFEDANGNSAVTILGGDGTFELWKVSTSTATADYATGTKLTSPTVGNEKFRFIGVSGFDIVGVDINSNVRRRTSMAKGVYTQSFYVGEQIQLANAPVVDDINEKVDLMQVDLEAIKGTGFTKDKHSLTNIKKKAALAAALST